MIHLLPLPGAPLYANSREEIRERAIRDAESLSSSGFDALLVENFGDIPFSAEGGEAHVIAEMSVLVREIRLLTALPVGVQVLRNDAKAAMAIAAAADASFIRVNVHTGTMFTDQGMLQGQAHSTLRYRHAIDAGRISILADVFVKHATPPIGVVFDDAVQECVERGMANGIIVSGSGTSRETDVGMLESAVARSNVPVYVGSGVTEKNLSRYIPLAHGVIAGTALKYDGDVSQAVDVERCRCFVEKARKLLAS